MRLIDVIIGMCWIVFWLYWIASAFTSKKDAPSSNVQVFVASRVGLLVLAFLVTVAFHQLPPSVTRHSLGISLPLQIVGLIIFLAGFYVTIWARRHLGKNWGMPMTEKLKPKLITTGPYQYIRHPIYTGMLLMIIGSAVDENAYWLIVFVVAIIYFSFCAVIEEKNMHREFPKDYPLYKRQTKMLVPYVF